MKSEKREKKEKNKKGQGVVAARIELLYRGRKLPINISCDGSGFFFCRGQDEYTRVTVLYSDLVFIISYLY